MDHSEVINRHERIALQFSGGKDSLACLYLMKPHWDKLTVYYLNSGNPFPETMDLMDRVRQEVPRFVEVMGNQTAALRKYGWPSDLIPTNATPLGSLINGDGRTQGLRLNDRYFCCFKSVMEPLQLRMIKDNITLIIRGQKNRDAGMGPLRSGDRLGELEFLYPVEDWSHDDVLNYLQRIGVEVPRYYREGMTSAPDCMDCTAWLEHGQPAYMRKHHPDKYKELAKRLNMIKVAVEQPAALLKDF